MSPRTLSYIRVPATGGACSIPIARRQARSAEADAERIEEQIAMHFLEAALDRQPADIAADRPALGDHTHVALERSRPGVEPEALALIIGGAGRQHAHRDLARVRRCEHALGDLRERAIAAHVDDDARAAIIARLAHAIARRALGLGRHEPECDLFFVAPRPRMTAPVRCLAALRRRIRDPHSRLALHQGLDPRRHRRLYGTVPP